MRIVTAVASLLLLFAITTSAFAQDVQKPEAIVDKMAFKFVRGVTNTVTAIAELPKQTYLSVRDKGAVGYVVGPVKGIGMTFYRFVVGAAEGIFFMVPQPGYYDPMLDPEFVWQGWGDKRAEMGKAVGSDQPVPAN